MPIQRRTPKRGFKNINRKDYLAINVSRLQELVEQDGIKSFDVLELKEQKKLPKTALVKILGNGSINSKVDVKAHAFSASAKEAIEAAGGTVTII